MKPIDHLKQLYLEANRSKYPNFPDHLRPMKKISTTTANSLTKAIVDFLNMSGHFASRINNQGTFVRDKFKAGGGYYRPSTQVKGIADISANINRNGTAYPVWIEVKVGKDKMSEAQKTFKERVEALGAAYLVVGSFDQFHALYNDLIKN
jgi:hypothetical protein